MLRQKGMHRTSRDQMPDQSRRIQQLTINPRDPLHPIRIDRDHADARDQHAGFFSGLLDGQAYEIDLGPRNQARFREALSPFISHGTQLGAGRKRAGSRRPRIETRNQTDRDRASRARHWALEHGVQLPSRGRVAQAVLDALADDNVPALYEAVGLEYEAETKPKRSRRKSTEIEFKA